MARVREGGLDRSCGHRLRERLLDRVRDLPIGLIGLFAAKNVNAVGWRLLQRHSCIYVKREL
jgi:hypothetical protein